MPCLLPVTEAVGGDTTGPVLVAAGCDTVTATEIEQIATHNVTLFNTNRVDLLHITLSSQVYSGLSINGHSE